MTRTLICQLFKKAATQLRKYLTKTSHVPTNYIRFFSQVFFIEVNDDAVRHRQQTDFEALKTKLTLHVKIGLIFILLTLRFSFRMFTFPSYFYFFLN